MLVPGETTVMGEVEAAFAGTYATEIKKELDEDSVEQMKEKVSEAEDMDS